MKTLVIRAACAALIVAPAGSAALAQERTFDRPTSGWVVVQSDGAKTAAFVATEMTFDGQVVKGAPYSAEATTESIQTLADGNRIVRSTTTSVFRDGEGRTRREQTLGPIGPWPAMAESGPMIFIHDPTAGINTILTPSRRIARRLPAPIVSVNGVGPAAGGRDTLVLRRAEAERARAVVKQRSELEVRSIRSARGGAAAGGNAEVVTITAAPGDEGNLQFQITAPENSQKEALGKRDFEGVQADGTRTVVTIPAGEIGNERAIEIVTERWYSPELQTVVYSRHSDPRFGETIFKLTNINRAEPDPSLFAIPSDYSVEESTRPGKVFVESKMVERRNAKKP